MRIIGSVIAHNEADRYLQASLAWNRHVFDELVVFDDRSTDNTAKIAGAYADKLLILGAKAPKFATHEGRFRSHCYKKLIEMTEPTEEDWILSLDADEFIVGSLHQDARDALEHLIWAATEQKIDAVKIRVPEVWSLDMPLRIRRDGYWDANFNPRLWRFKEDWEWKNSKLGCGSGPKYVWDGGLEKLQLASILHFGYAEPEDREFRYKRYAGDKNHNKKHIESILSTPDLVEFRGEVPKFWKGYRHV